MHSNVISHVKAVLLLVRCTCDTWLCRLWDILNYSLIKQLTVPAVRQRAVAGHAAAGGQGCCYQLSQLQGGVMDKKAQSMQALFPGARAQLSAYMLLLQALGSRTGSGQL